MTESFLISLLTTYGPLALGWVLAWYFVRQNTILQTRVMDTFIADTAAKIELKSALESLSDIIKGKN